MKQALVIFGVAAIALIGGLLLAKTAPSAPTPATSGTAAAVTTTLPPVRDTDWTKGPADAKATLIEYLDFQCPACAQTFPLVEQAVETNKDTTRLVIRYFPLAQHKNAVPSAKAAEAAGKQDKFFQMASLLFLRQSDWQDESNAVPKFEAYATELGLNLDQFKQDMTDQKVASKIQDSLDESTRLNLPGTPSFFLNGHAFDLTSLEQLNTALKDAAK